MSAVSRPDSVPVVAVVEEEDPGASSSSSSWKRRKMVQNVILVFFRRRLSQRPAVEELESRNILKREYFPRLHEFNSQQWKTQRRYFIE